MENIFAIVVSWNGLKHDWIAKCLASLRDSDTAIKTILIDNASTDDTVAFVRQNFPEVQLIASEENLGFGAANNLGFEKALEQGADYFFLLNQDARVDKDCVRRLVEQSKKNPEYGILSPIHLNGKGDEVEDFFATRMAPQYCEKLCSDFVLNRVEDRIYESGFINAACWLISKACLKKVGGFSPVFYHYGEDDNFFHRMKHKQFKLGIYPKTFIYHDKENNKSPALFNKNLNRRTVLMILSEPDRQYDFAHYLRHFRKEFLKRKLTGDKSGAAEALGNLNYFKKERAWIESTRAETMTDRPFLFLNFKED